MKSKTNNTNPHLASARSSVGNGKTTIFRFMAGYTVLELMITVAIVGIVAAVAIPSLEGTMRRNATESVLMDLMSSLNYARTEAVTSGNAVSVCRSTDQANCTLSSEGGDWTDGWLIFTDKDSDGVFDGGVDEILQAQETFDRNFVVRLMIGSSSVLFTTEDHVSFNQEGNIFSLAMTEVALDGVYFKLCPSDNVAADARAVLVYPTGRSAGSRDSVGAPDGVHNYFTGANLVCP